MIYFLLHTPTNTVKIGRAHSLLGRLATLATAHPILEDLVLLQTISGDQEEEYRLHSEFGDYHVRGEWFRLAGRLAEYLAPTSRPVTLAALLASTTATSRTFGRERSNFWRAVHPQVLHAKLSGRYVQIAIRYHAGETMEQIAVDEHCSRQRIHQILKRCQYYCSLPSS